MTIRAIYSDGMTNIDEPSISYGNIHRLYSNGSGHGLQLDPKQDHKRGEILDLCAEIADKLQQLDEVLKR